MRSISHILWRTALLAALTLAACLAVPLLSRYELMSVVVWLVHEDGPLETIGAISCLAGAVLFVAAFAHPRSNLGAIDTAVSNAPPASRSAGSGNFWCLLLAALLVFMFGEEINWGQRLIGYAVPERFLAANIQHEFNLHNNRLVHARLDENRLKLAWVFLTAGYLGILPLVAAVLPLLRRMVDRIRLPLASVPLAAAVLLATAMYLILTTRKVAAGDYPGAHDIGETNECLIEVAYLLMAIQIWRESRAATASTNWKLALVMALVVGVPGVPLTYAFVRSALAPEPMLRAVAALRTGDARQRAGDPESAIARYRESLSIIPSQIAVHLRLASVYLRLNRIDDAQREYEAVLKLDDRNVEAHARLGAILLQAGLVPEAAAQLATAIELAPRFAPAHYYLGLVRLEQRSPAEAAACFREALRLQPNFPPAQDALTRLAAEGY
ncbi:MAG: tetratricopeptide repeat protein [Pirellulales bacterium]